jgi:lysophospholipase L1-like esterase
MRPRALPAVLALVALLVPVAGCDAGDRADRRGADAPRGDAPFDAPLDVPLDDAPSPGAPSPGAPTDGPTAATPVEDGPAAGEVPDPVRYVALGDSIAAGSAAGTSYVAEYARWLEDETGATVSVSNLAVPGWTATDLLAALRADDELRAELAEAHLVTFNIGGNDLLTSLRGLRDGRCGGGDELRCLEEAVTGLHETWEELLAELLGVVDGEPDGLRTMDLYLPTLPETVLGARAVLQAHLDDVNHRLADAAEGAGVEVARVHDAFADAAEVSEDAELLAGDGIHPSDRGHEYIAEQLAELGTALNRVD